MPGILFLVAGILGAAGFSTQLAWVLVAIAGALMLTPIVVQHYRG